VSSAAPSSVAFGDAHVTLDAQSAVVMSRGSGESTAVVERGGAWFAVAPRGHRPPFIVVAGDTVVRVVGTRFRVARIEEVTVVEVEHGLVDASFHGTHAAIGAGQRWSSAHPDEITPVRTAAIAPAPIDPIDPPAPPMLDPPTHDPATASTADPPVAEPPPATDHAPAKTDPMPPSPTDHAPAKTDPVPPPADRAPAKTDPMPPSSADRAPAKTDPVPPPADRAPAKADPGKKTAPPVDVKATTESKPAEVDNRARFEQLAALEPRDPGAAIAGYLELSARGGRWAEVGLYAAARLAADRRDPRAATLLHVYLRRFPTGANANDVRLHLDRIQKGQPR
ncbi:MAG: FecR domain-containing protein, partial [Deltaproteobacteria bacterium]|nr:FecR domain-containing protein [Deltaproteobacteria bacterium]